MASEVEKSETGESARKSEFESEAAGKRVGLTTEFMEFLGQNKKWWLLPIIVVILLLGVLVLISGTPVGPFIYTLF